MTSVRNLRLKVQYRQKWFPSDPILANISTMTEKLRPSQFCFEADELLAEWDSQHKDELKQKQLDITNSDVKVNLRKLGFALKHFPDHPYLKGYEKLFDQKGDFIPEKEELLKMFLEKFEFDLANNGDICHVIDTTMLTIKLRSWENPEAARKARNDAAFAEGERYRQMSLGYAQGRK